MKIKSFKDLEAWKEAHDLVLEIYRITKKFPSEEKFSLTSQVQRSAVSVPSNIAEGFGRSGRKEKQRFYANARGSLYELQAQLQIAKDIGYVPEERYANIEKNIIMVAKLISGLIKSATERVDNEG